MDALALPGHHADLFAFFIRFGIQYGLPHLVVQGLGLVLGLDHGNRRGQHRPDGFLVIQVHGRAPEAPFPVAGVFFRAVGRGDIGGLRLHTQQVISRGAGLFRFRLRRFLRRRSFRFRFFVLQQDLFHDELFLPLFRQRGHRGEQKGRRQ